MQFRPKLGRYPNARDDLTIREDGYSIQVSRDDDPAFWVRVALSSGAPHRVTDLNAGAQDVRMLARALVTAIYMSGGRLTDGIEIVDPAPENPVMGCPSLDTAVRLHEPLLQQLAAEVNMALDPPGHRVEDGRLVIEVSFHPRRGADLLARLPAFSMMRGR